MSSLYVLRTSTRSSDIEVGLQSVTTALSPEAGLAHATEGTGRVEAVVGVGPNHAGAQPLGDPVCSTPLLAPYATGQSVLRVVRLGDRLFGRAERQHRCLLYTSDAADEEDSVDLGGRRI